MRLGTGEWEGLAQTYTHTHTRTHTHTHIPREARQTGDSKGKGKKHNNKTTSLACLPCRFLQEIQRLPSRLYLIWYIWANSLPMPPAWRPCVPTSVMKCSEPRSICRNSFSVSGSTVISGHHAPSPSSKSNLERERQTETETEREG